MKRAWIQNILIALLAVVLLGALVYFVLNPGRSISSEACRNIVVEVSSRGSSSPRFLTQQQVIDELSRRGLRLKGQKLDSIDLRRIERSLTELGIYDKVSAYVAPATHSVKIHLEEKNPYFLVIDDRGASYYITEGRGIIKGSTHFASYLPLVTGTLSEQYARQEVYDLFCTLQADSYYRDYYGQLQVSPQRGIVMIPRVGTTELILGKGGNWAEKLRKWRIFAASVLPRRGMNAFSYVKLDYEGQVVAAERYPALEEELDEEGERRSPSVSPQQPRAAASPQAVAPAPHKAEPKKGEVKKAEPHKAEPKKEAKKEAKKEPRKEPKKDAKPERKKDSAPKQQAAKAEPRKAEPKKNPAAAPAKKAPSKESKKPSAEPHPKHSKQKPTAKQPKH